MKTSFIYPSIICLSLIVAGCAGSKKADYVSHTTPGYVKLDYKQIIVYAKIEQNAYRYKLEDGMADYLNGHGYRAIPAYKNIEVSYGYDSVAFMKRINELKVDGVLVFSYLGNVTKVTDSYQYNGGMYNYLYGGSIPLDLDTRSEKVGYLRIDFFNIISRTTQWNTSIPILLSNPIDHIIKEMAQECVFRMKADKIL